jgi:hypothetical protein
MYASRLIKPVAVFPVAVFTGLLLLASCSGSNSEGPQIGLQVPERIRQAAAVDQQAVSATVIIGDERVTLVRNGDQFIGTINVPSGTELSYVLEISEQVAGDSIVLAQMTGTRQITNDTAINLFRNQYTFPDNDSDGFNNLAEREAGSDHANSNSTPNNIDGGNNGDETPGVLQFSSDSYAVSEDAGSLQISVARSNGSDGAVSVGYRLSNETAFAGQDFADSAGTLSWADGESDAKVIDISVFSDTDFEGEQTFGINLFSATGGAAIGNGFARITIRDSTPAPQRGTLQLAERTITIDENAQRVTVLVERVGGDEGLVTVDYQTADGTATDGEDYSGVSEARTLAWSDGDSAPKQINISINQDALTEPTETFDLLLSGVRGGATLGTAQTTVRITDTTEVQLQNGELTLATTDQTVSEGDTAEITVARRNGSDGAVSIDYTVSSGTADSQDFTAQTGTLSWADGDSADKTISIATIADNTLENAETFTVTLAGANGGATIGQSSITVTITDATASEFGSVAFAEPAGAVDEGQTLVVEVVRTGSPNSPVTVDIQAENSATGEIELSAQSLSWSAAETGAKSFTVTALADTVTGDTGTTLLSLDVSSGTPAILADSYLLTISDTSRPGFIEPLASDGEWEVCLLPLSTTDATAFSSQSSAITGATVTCIKACPDNADPDTVFAGWGWNATGGHSCFFTDAAPGTVSKVPVYLPQRETFTLSLDGDTFATGTTAWLCRPENRTNSATPYVADPDRFLWLQLTDDGTYTYAETTTAVAPTLFTGPALWNVAERFLSLGHIGELFRNVKVDAGSSAFTMYRTTDTRWSCGVTDIDDV